MRILLQSLLVFVPFLIYGGWMMVARRGEERGWNSVPWFWLTVAGLSLCGLSFFAVGLMEEGRSGTYVPPRWHDGRIVPGHTE